MTQQIINLGLIPNDGSGDALRVGAQKINENFTELYDRGIPEQAGNNGKVLTTSGTVLRWDRVSDITGNAATVTNGVYTTGSYNNPSWLTGLDPSKVLPSQSGNNGKYLTTDGNLLSWVDLDAVSIFDYNNLINKPIFPDNTSDLVNDSGFITSSALTGYATESYVTTRGYITSAAIPVDISELTDTGNLLGGGGASLGDLAVVISPGGTDTLQNITAGQNVHIAATESGADLNDGNVRLQYNPHPDTTAPYITNNSLNIDGIGIVLDAGVNTIRLDAAGLDFDEGYKLPLTQGSGVSAAGSGVVYTTVAYPRVVKLILKAKLLDDYQACEMMVVRSNSDPVVINHTVYAVIHTTTNPFVTYDANWNALSSKIEITATNLDVTNPIYVESMVIEVLEWD